MRRLSIALENEQTLRPCLTFCKVLRLMCSNFQQKCHMSICCPKTLTYSQYDYLLTSLFLSSQILISLPYVRVLLTKVSKVSLSSLHVAESRQASPLHHLYMFADQKLLQAPGWGFPGVVSFSLSIYLYNLFEARKCTWISCSKRE